MLRSPLAPSSDHERVSVRPTIWNCIASTGIISDLDPVQHVRSAPVVGVVFGLGLAVVTAVTQEASLDGRLRHLFPDASGFSPKMGNPPHFQAYGAAPNDGSGAPVIGYAFYTTELEPLERGYDGPIQLLVGMDRRGRLTGVVVTDHNEPYGYFSIDLPEYPAQFEDKSIRERFRVGDDVDAVSRATITVRSATRAVRNGARRLARRVLDPDDLQ